MTLTSIFLRPGDDGDDVDDDEDDVDDDDDDIGGRTKTDATPRSLHSSFLSPTKSRTATKTMTMMTTNLLSS